MGKERFSEITAKASAFGTVASTIAISAAMIMGRESEKTTQFNNRFEYMNPHIVASDGRLNVEFAQGYMYADPNSENCDFIIITRSSEGGVNVFKVKKDNGVEEQLTHDTNENRNTALSSDCDRVIYSSSLGTKDEVFLISIDDKEKYVLQELGQGERVESLTWDENSVIIQSLRGSTYVYRKVDPNVEG